MKINIVVSSPWLIVNYHLNQIFLYFTPNFIHNTQKISYLEAGYEYVNIDDCWTELERDENGKIVADKERFPRGIKFLSDYVSNKFTPHWLMTNKSHFVFFAFYRFTRKV